MAFAVVYWVIYPSWPMGKGFLPGVDKVTFTNAEGQKVTWHWNTRAKLMQENEQATLAQKPYYDKLSSMSYAQITKDPELNSFVISAGKSVFSDNCAACHQAGGQGKLGLAPNLTDDDWIYGGTFDKINETITKGRHGYMPPFGEALDPDQIDDLANYVATLSGLKADPAKAAKGNEMFHGQVGACYYCHNNDGKGRKDIGSANLTDRIWLWANVPGASDEAGKIAAIRRIITSGVSRGVMPSWEGRLSKEQIKLMTVYVHELGGGQ
jgi:cytochrome c oxidase cbb3-type subunit 3